MKGKLTVLTQADYEAWAAEASKKSAIAYIKEDQDAHWGWDWVLYGASGKKQETEQPAAASVQGGK